jgi:transcriptional regulator with XRE-family HTH domain
VIVLRKKFPYQINNKIGDLLKEEKKNREIVRENKVSMEALEKELADHCGISINGIRRIKRNLSSVSLQVAFRISEYFQLSIQDIFTMTKEELNDTKKNKKIKC